MNSTLSSETKNHFRASFTMNLWWSILYELLRIIHTSTLAYFMDPQSFGIMGTIFASIFLVAKCTDLGTAYTITPFFSAATADKKNFVSFTLNYSIIPLSITFLLIGGGCWWYGQPTININSSLLIIVSAVAFLESIRSFLRQLLHIAFQSSAIIIAEFTLFLMFLGIVWGPVLLNQSTVHYTTIFYVFSLDSLFAVIFLSYKAIRLYQTLPSSTEVTLPTYQKILSIRWVNFFIRMSSSLSSTNLVTPLFALKFGLKSAGVFYLLSTIAMASQAIIKATIGHAGNALLAQAKNSSLLNKQAVFSYVSTRFLVVVSVIGLVFSGTHYIVWKNNLLVHHDAMLLLFVGAYLMIAFSDLFTSMYEYFYVLEESLTFLSLIRAFEYALFYLVTFRYSFSPLTTLTLVLMIRTISFLGITSYAKRQWQIAMVKKIPLKYIGGSLLTLLIVVLYRIIIN